MKNLLVYAAKNFKITVPDDAKITFGPWSPPKKGKNWETEDRVGTLRVYQGTKDNILACFSGVTGFRDLGLNYLEEIAIEEGAKMGQSTDSRKRS